MKDRASENLVLKVVDELARIRKEQAISHETLSQMTGLSRPAISFIESHKSDPKLVNCAKIARALGVRLADVIDKFEK